MVGNENKWLMVSFPEPATASPQVFGPESPTHLAAFQVAPPADWPQPQVARDFLIPGPPRTWLLEWTLPMVTAPEQQPAPDRQVRPVPAWPARRSDWLAPAFSELALQLLTAWPARLVSGQIL